MLCLYALAALLCHCTPSSSSESLTFLALGDWGGQDDKPYTTDGETAVAKQMGKTASELNSSFTVVVGDNFYENGVTSEYDKRFQETFEDVFTADSLMGRWYVVAGNHDHYGNTTAQVAYTQHSKRWYFPSLYYTQTIPLGSSGATVQFVFIDTILLAGLTHPVLRHLPPKPLPDQQAADDQWAWIESTLSSSNATWLYVVGHYPVWSVSHHGPTDVLVQRLNPMLQAHNISAYLNGHDHNMQHIRPKGQTVDYFTSGAGHGTEDSVKHKDDVPKDSLKFFYGPSDKHEDHGGFMTFTLTPELAVATFFNYKGKLLYSTKNDKPRQ